MIRKAEKTRTVPIILLILITSVPLQSQDFLFLGSGARAQGMGGSFVGISDDVSALYWNPAGLVQLEKSVLSVYSSTFRENKTYNNLMFAYPTKIGAFGIISMGLSPKESKNSDEDRYNSTYLSYGTNIYGGVSAGLTYKTVGYRNFDYISTDKTYDISFFYAPREGKLENYRFGLIFQNITNPNLSTSTSTAKENLGYGYRLGVGYSVPKELIKKIDDRLIISSDLEYNASKNFILHLGSEYSIEGKRHSISFRTGYDGYGLTYGAGFRYKNFSFDFGNSSSLEVLNSHFGLTLQFGLTSKELKDKQKRQIESEMRKKSMDCYKKGEEFLRGEKYEQAIVEFSKAFFYDPHNTTIQTKFDMAEEKLKLQQRERKIEEYMSKGLEYYRAEKYSESFEQFKLVLQYDPFNIVAKRYINDISNILAARVTVSDKAKDYLKSVYQVLIDDNYELAISGWKKVLEVSPDSEDARKNIELLEKQRNEKKNTHLKLAEQYYRGKYLKDALKEYKLVLKYDSGDNDVKNKIEKLDSEINETEKEKTALYEKGMDLFNRENWMEANIIFNRIAKMDPSDKKVERYLAITEQKINESKVYSPDESKKFYNEGLKQYTAGNLENALEFFKKAVELDPENQKAQTALERTKKELKK